MRSKTMTNGNVRHECVKILSLILMNMDFFVWLLMRWDPSIDQCVLI